jgi:hypothetical protein
MSQAICLADWDGTLRRGYVLEDWMQFLYSAHVASGDDLATIDSFFRKHECREIDYGQMAEGVVRAYTSMLRGKNYDTCRNLARRFVEADSKVFEFAGPLIEAFTRGDF